MADSKEFIVAHIGDLCKRSEQRNIICSSDFLSDAEITDISKIYGKNGVVFFGGFNHSERKCAVFLPDYYSCEDILSEPVLCGISFCRVKISDFDEGADISHRDVLGSLMGLGIERECIGDIAISDKIIEIALRDSVCGFVCENLSKISRYAVKNEYCEKPFLDIKQEFEEKRISVASMRADGVISAVFNVSRDLSYDSIKDGLVTVDGKEIYKPDGQLQSGIKLSFRGKGKAIIEKTDSVSKKGRIVLNIKYYK